jgi:hypothetical protein
MTKKVEEKSDKKIVKFLDQANNALEKAQKQIAKYSEGPKKVMGDVINFLKKHKKLLITVGVLYLLFDYLFGEVKPKEKEDDNDDEPSGGGTKMMW